MSYHHQTKSRARALLLWRARQPALWASTLLVVLAFIMAAVNAQARGAPDSFADLAERLLPAVVNVSTTQTVGPGEMQDFQDLFREFFDRRGGGQEPPPQQMSSLGSGFIIDSSGYIVTNNHVIENADEITVRLQDDRILPATLVGRDVDTDLALLKVESATPLPAVDWGNSDVLRIGDWVLAIGNPFGFGGSVTAGIVSAMERNINAGRYDAFIQTDAAINRGNSGGPMFDMDGNVVGVNTAIISPSGGSIGIGFAIPASIANNVISQLREFGEVRRGWLGVRIQTVTPELAEGLRLDNPSGALVSRVTEGGPAQDAGIEEGDVILTFNGEAVGEMRRLPLMVADTPVGTSVPVTVWRQGEELTLYVELGRLDEAVVNASVEQPTRDAPGADDNIPGLGLALQPITQELADRFRLDDVQGVVIVKVDETGPAFEKGLRPGDVIVEIDQEEVTNPDEVNDAIDRAVAEGYRVVTLLIYRQGDFQWVAVPITEG